MKKISEVAKAGLSSALSTKSLLVFTVLVISVLLQQSASVSSVQSAILVGDAGYFEVAGVVHINQSPYICPANVDYCYANFTSFFALPVSATLSIETLQLDVLEFQELKNVTGSVTIFNLTQNVTVWGNSTVQNDTVRVNVTSQLQNTTAWTNLGLDTFTYNNKTWKGTTISLANKGLKQYRMKLHPKNYGGLIEYSLLGNASGLYVEFDPILNATAANITSNADLNLSIVGVTDLARFVDGKLIMAAGNRSNITAWETFADNDFNNRSVWQQYNETNTALGITYSRVTVQGSQVNLSVDDAGGNAAVVELVHPSNLSIPAASGLIISAYGMNPYTSGSFETGICLVPAFDKIANRTTNVFGCQHSGANGGAVKVGMNSNGRLFEIQINSSAPNTFGSPTPTAFSHFIIWINRTHVNLTINSTEGNGVAFSSLLKHGIAFDSGAAIVLWAYASGATETKSFTWDNITVANSTQFGQPFNLTSVRFETNILNSTITVDKVKISNVTHNYANTVAKFFAMDNNSKNQQGVNEGSFVDITDFVGLKINGTFVPNNLYSATELTSILVEWSTAVGGGAATEAEGDTAIEMGINSSLSTATKYKEQQVYVRNLSNNQTLGTFDLVAAFGNQRWLLNYITAGESYVRAPNLTTAVYVLELTSKTSAQITDEVSRLINSTKQ